jgi:hypothetical protein
VLIFQTPQDCAMLDENNYKLSSVVTKEMTTTVQ